LRDRNLLRLFLVLKRGLAGAFVAYLFLSRNNHPAVLPAHFVTEAKAPAKTRQPHERAANCNPNAARPGSAGCAPKPALQRESGSVPALMADASPQRPPAELPSP